MKLLDGMSRKILGISYLILLGAMIATCVVGFIYPDIWWQLKEGSFILYNWKLPHAPLNAFGLSNAPFPHEYAFYELLIASIYRPFGLLGLRVFFFVVAFFPFAYAFGWIAEKRRWDFGSFYLILFAYFLLVLRIQQRPEILANVFFIFILHLLLVRDFRASPYFLIMFFWANTHASFIVGLGAVALWIANDIWVNKRRNIFDLTKVGLASLAGSVLNPSGIGYLIEPFKLQSATWSKLTSTEMLPMTAWGYPFILIAVALSGVVIWRTGWKKQLWLLAMIAGVVVLSLASQRYVNLFGCLLCVLVFVNVRAGEKFTGTKKIFDFVVTTFVFMPSLILLSIFLISALPHNSFKKDYLQHFAAVIVRALPDEEKKVLAEIRVGSYINGTTENLRAFLDTGFNRFEQDNLRYYYDLDNNPEALDEALELLPIDYVIIDKFNHYWSFVLSEHPRWQPAQIESRSVLYAKRDAISDGDPKRLVLWDARMAKFYEPKRLIVQETLRNINSSDAWRDGKCCAFLNWWLEKQNPQELEDFLKNTTNIQPALELFLLEKLKRLELAKLSEKKYAAADRFSSLLRAQIFLSRDDSENAQKELQGLSRRFVSSSWEAEIFQKAYPKSKFDHLLWGYDNQKWFLEFTKKLSQ